MKTDSDSVFELRKRNQERLQRTRKWFELCTMFLEAEDLESSAGLAQKIANELSIIRDELKKHYADVLLDRRMPRLDEDRKRVDALAGARLNEERPTDYAGLVQRLYADLLALERDSRFLYPRPPWYEPMVRRFWKETPLPALFNRYRTQVLAGAGIAIVLISVAAAVQYHRGRRHGLIGAYYSDKNMKKPFKTRIDRRIDFDWEKRGPYRKLRENFSVSWTGYLIVDKPGAYEISLMSDDGSALFIDDREVISDWRDHGREYNRARVELTEGAHPIRLDYYQNRGDAAIRLMWRLETEIQAVIIPAENLVTEERYLPGSSS